jgi:hypothetical protein
MSTTRFLALLLATFLLQVPSAFAGAGHSQTVQHTNDLWAAGAKLSG